MGKLALETAMEAGGVYMLSDIPATKEYDAEDWSVVEVEGR